MVLRCNHDRSIQIGIVQKCVIVSIDIATRHKGFASVNCITDSFTTAAMNSCCIILDEAVVMKNEGY